jgi:transcriptional regulator GlxA family with amidase domain
MSRNIAFVIFPNFQLLDAAGPLAAFDIASRFAGGAYSLRIFAAQAGAVASSSGAALHAEAFGPRPRFHTVIAAGGSGVREAIADAAVSRFISSAAKRAQRIASVCSGAYLVATLGLLDGRRATTHWNRSADFARRFPGVRLEPDRIYVRDGNVWTSAGITAGIDLALAMIADDLGEGVARQTAQQLVVYYRRPGGQSQFSALLELDRPDGRFAAMLRWAREHLDEKLGVERLAARAAMSPRNFARLFVRETGMTPARHRASAGRGRARARRGRLGLDRPGRGALWLRRSRTDAPRLSSHLRPAAAGFAPRRTRLNPISKARNGGRQGKLDATLDPQGCEEWWHVGFDGSSSGVCLWSVAGVSRRLFRPSVSGCRFLRHHSVGVHFVDRDLRSDRLHSLARRFHDLARQPAGGAGDEHHHGNRLELLFFCSDPSRTIDRQHDS